MPIFYRFAHLCRGGLLVWCGDGSLMDFEKTKRTPGMAPGHGAQKMPRPWGRKGRGSRKLRWVSNSVRSINNRLSRRDKFSQFGKKPMGAFPPSVSWIELFNGDWLPDNGWMRWDGKKLV